MTEDNIQKTDRWLWIMLLVSPVVTADFDVSQLPAMAMP